MTMLTGASASTAGCKGSYLSTIVIVLSFAVCRITGANMNVAHEVPYDCKLGCRKAFEPVCGADGRTYGNPCLATCQGIQVAEHGPCPGEPILHPANAHVVTGSGEDGSTVLPPHHMDAFRHEGYRYAGQLTFTGEMPARQHGRNDGRQPQQQQQQHGSGGSGLPGLEQQPPQLRAMRVTREGHFYMADMDESVDMVIDTLIKRHGNASTDSPHVPVPALLHSLQQWRDYRGVRGGGRGGSKWARHTVVSRHGPGEHPLQPELDTGGAAAAFTAQSLPEQGEQQQPTATSQDEEQLGAGGVQQSWGAGGQQRDQAPQHGERHRQARRSLGVFDVDDRLDCPRTPTYPFTAMGQINVHDKSGNYVCSGALVGPDVVLTAAHCVFNRGAQAFYERLDFAPARYRTLDSHVVNPFGVVPWSYVTVYQGYSSLSAADPNIIDIAIITLSQRIGTQAGWMGVFEPCSPYAPSRYVALTAGYPSDQPSGSCKSTQCVVLQDPCTDGYLYHKCDTASGQSGSPMYMMAMTASRRMGPYVRGVHNIEWVQEMPNGQTVSYINSAVSITPDHYRSILAWIGLSFSVNGSSTPMGPALPPANYMSTISAGR